MSLQPWDSHSGTAYEAYEDHVGMRSEFESVAHSRAKSPISPH